MPYAPSFGMKLKYLTLTFIFSSNAKHKGYFISLNTSMFHFSVTLG